MHSVLVSYDDMYALFTLFTFPKKIPNWIKCLEHGKIGVYCLLCWRYYTIFDFGIWISLQREDAWNLIFGTSMKAEKRIFNQWSLKKVIYRRE